MKPEEVPAEWVVIGVYSKLGLTREQWEHGVQVVRDGLMRRHGSEMEKALAAVLPLYGASVLEEAADQFDREAAAYHAASCVADVRCPRCNLRYEERDQYSCGEPGHGHEYDDAELLEAGELHIERTVRGDELREHATRLIRNLPTPARDPECPCAACDPGMLLGGERVPFATRMALCPDCGNKRCPKATDHREWQCSGSNEPGQVGVRAAAAPSSGKGARA